MYEEGVVVPKTWLPDGWHIRMQLDKGFDINFLLTDTECHFGVDDKIRAWFLPLQSGELRRAFRVDKISKKRRVR